MRVQTLGIARDVVTFLLGRHEEVKCLFAQVIDGQVRTPSPRYGELLAVC
jgi:hypothetical protein